MIAEIMLALLYWLLGVLFALCAFCALGCIISLFLSVLTSFKVPSRLLGTPLWVFFSFVCLGVCWLLQWIYITLGNHTDHAVQYWFIVGAVLPGILGVTLVPKFIALATGGGKSTALTPRPIDSAKA
jgi:hypothetical protein